MNNFQPLGILIPRYLTGTLKNGILLLYSGPSYLEFLDLMKRDDPDVYNRLLADVAKGNSPSSEVVRYRDADGNMRSTTNVEAGYVSGTDPVGLLVVEGAVMNKPLQWVGKGIGNLVKAKLISREMRNIKTPTGSKVVLTELEYLPVKQLEARTNLSMLQRNKSKISEAERLGIPKGERNYSSKSSKYTLSEIKRALELPTQNPKTISSLSRIDRANLNIPTTGLSQRYLLSSIGNNKLSPEIKNTILYIKENVEPLPEFMDKAYYDAFMKHMQDLDINTDIIELSPRTVALILTDQYNLLTNTATGVIKNKVFSRVDPKIFSYFDWKKHLGETNTNTGFWGSGNYFSTGMSRNGTAKPFIISGIDELAYDPEFFYNSLKGSRWMLDNPLKRMIVSTPEGARNRYGFINNGKDEGIEVVTLKNTGIKSLFPDFTTANGKTFARNWKDPNIFRGIIGLGTLHGITNKNK